MIRVLLVDDHRIVRQGLRQVLADTTDIVVAGEAADGLEALRQVRECRHPVDGDGLDVVMLDIALPDRDGLDVLKQIKGEVPDLPVLMLSTYPDKQYAVRALRLGAAGYLNKSADPDEMVMALRKAAQGGRHITASVAEALANSISQVHGQPAHEALSQREHQVFLLLAEGRSVSRIAEQLHLSPNTVSTYRARVLEKTGTRNDVELALYAVRQQVLAI
jgi:DNA-binding NarL/FixJ family response regulator